LEGSHQIQSKLKGREMKPHLLKEAIFAYIVWNSSKDFLPSIE
jgi:hypothetical protein